ncbi:MAG: hypothetical protein J6T60_04380 [Bacteroidales bacterium]|nr:hypothetical protein [Bacteroidales bacterium]
MAKRILTLCLIIGLISSGCEDDRDDSETWLWEQVFINNTDISPIKLTYYRTARDWSLLIIDSLIINSDTMLVNNRNWNIYIPTDHLYDSINVDFNGVKKCTYYRESNQKYNPCNEDYYKYEEISHTHRRFTFEFTDDMLQSILDEN